MKDVYFRSSAKCNRCDGDLWERVDNTTVKCGNCNLQRKSKLRERCTERTNSQIEKIEQIKKFFINNWNRGRELHMVKIEQTTFGDMFFHIETTDNAFTMNGASGLIGRRGGITWFMDLSMIDSKLKHYAKMLGGKIAK